MTFTKLIFISESQDMGLLPSPWVFTLVFTSRSPHWHSAATDTGQASPATAGSRPQCHPNPAHDRGRGARQLLRRSYARRNALSDSWALWCRMWQPERTDTPTEGNILGNINITIPHTHPYAYASVSFVGFKLHKWSGPVNEVYEGDAHRYPPVVCVYCSNSTMKIMTKRTKSQWS